MYKIISTLIVLVGLTAAAFAEEQSLPDLKGTWTGKGDGVFVTQPGSVTDSQFREVDIKLVIKQQQGRRFSGTITMSGDARPVVGVIKFDGGILWSEPSGFVEGQLRDENTIQGCFVRISSFSQLAACEILKRQK